MLRVINLLFFVTLYVVGFGFKFNSINQLNPQPVKGSIPRNGPKKHNVNEDECGDDYTNIGNCYTKIHVCAGFYDWEWKYYGYASTNGTQGPTTPHYDSKEGAGTHAVQLLFDELPNSVSDCNCGYVNNYQVGQCTMDIKECFRFNSSTDVENSKPDFFAWVTPVDDTSVTGYFCCDYNETVTAENAIKNLEAKDKSCFL